VVLKVFDLTEPLFRGLFCLVRSTEAFALFREHIVASCYFFDHEVSLISDAPYC